MHTLLEFFDTGRRDGGSFDSGIQFALERVLVDPGLSPARPSAIRCAKQDRYRLSDLELASRLSFFLWSSIPDERLLALAERGQLDEAADPAKRKCGECWPIRARPMRSWTISPRSG